MSKFEDMTVAELKEIVKGFGITGYSKMRKQELLNAIEDQRQRNEMALDNVQEIDEILETVDDMSGLPFDELPEASEAEQEGFRSIAGETLDIVQTESVGRIVQPAAFPLVMNRAMRRKQAALARRASKRVA